MRPTLDWLADPEVFQVNRINAHSDHSFTTPQGDLLQSLNGTWSFAYSECPEDRPVDFYREDYSAEGFGTIQVPGHIQLQGFDRCQYTNLQYPWEGSEQLVPPQIPRNRNPVGSYLHFFDLDPALKNKKVYISFQGVETAFYIWLNGQFVGYSEDSFTPSEFDLTPYIKETNNRLAVEVYRFSTASWLEDQDFWRFSGIFRDVYLYAVPKTHVRDIRLSADFDYAAGNGLLTAALDIVGEAGYSLSVALLNADGSTVYEGCDSSFSASVPDVKPWSAEQPYLYTLTATLTDAEGAVIESASTQVGFRTFELKNGLMCLNGKRIVFRGVNRHEFSAQRGRSITEEDMLFDIRLMKQNNINAVRTSHYPNNSRWYQLCDLYGIYLIDETNLETHGTWQRMFAYDPEYILPGSHPEWLGAVLDRAQSMYERDKNHPSVLIWSCGNESNCGDDIAAMAEYFHRVDKGRLVHYEGVVHCRKYDYITDMESRMYAKPADIEEYLQKNTGKPYISCEYMHAMGNSVGGMSLYTDLEDKYDAYQGGFIWDYIDQALYIEDAHGHHLAYGGDFGDRPSDYGFCTNGIVTADRQPSVKLQEVRALYSPLRLTVEKGALIVHNRNLFAGTDGYVFRVALERDGEVLDAEEHRISVAAGECGSVVIGLTVPEQPGEYVFTASALLDADTLWAQRGHEIAFGQEVVTVSGAAQSQCTAKLDVAYTDIVIGVHGEGFSMMFDKRQGGLSSLVYGGVEYITRTPRVSFWRAPTDNDSGAGYPFATAQWRITGQFACCPADKVTMEKSEGQVTIVFPFIAPTVPVFEYQVIYTVRADGQLTVRAEYPGVEGMADLPVFAMDFRLDREYSSFTYRGMGPDENYIDRCKGARLDTFTSTADDNFSGYLNPQECGNRTGVRYVEVYNGEHRGLRFACTAQPFEMSVLPYNACQLTDALHREELPAPDSTWVRLCAKQMGVGGDDSWGAPVHQEYKIPADQPMTLEFTVEPVNK